MSGQIDRIHSPVTLQRTGQGCPLWLFALFITALAISIRSNSKINDVSINSGEHTIHLFADDVAIVTSKPEMSLQESQRQVDRYSKVSGFKGNYKKISIIGMQIENLL